jgi:TFIIH basal transcription factor complex TTD-A subunit
MKQFLLYLDETTKLGRKFIIQDLDENHLFISADILETLQAKIDDLMDQISFQWLANRLVIWFFCGDF